MQVRSIRSLSASDADAVIVGMFPGRRAGAGTATVMKGMGPWVRKALETAKFDGDTGQVAVLPSTNPEFPAHVVFAGLGADLDLEALRQAAGRAMRALPEMARTVATTLHRVDIDGAAQATLEGLALADYRFDRYRSSAAERREISVEFLGGDKKDVESAGSADIIAEAVGLARDLVNESPSHKAPLEFADRITDAAAEAGVAHEVWSGDRLIEEKMAGLLAVGGGSHRPPCLIRLEYRPRRPKATLYLVGKGIVFDSGGLSLKPSNFMETMKCDMAGAAAVAGGVIAVARLGLRLNVIGLAAMAENLPGGGAQRPGDVITYRNGKTVEVLNTDAEGRLVMADALCLAAEAAPDLIVDLATLTGAAKVALGPKIAGLFGNDEEAVARVKAAADAAGERTWPMPMPKDYFSLIESSVADMKNTITGRYGGAQGAALLLAEFAGEGPWVHMDIAGPAFVDAAEHYIPKGGTGFGVRTVIELAAGMA
jgi:leucyl aminopeptidase